MKGRCPEDFIVFVFNFTPVPRAGYRIGLPKAGVCREAMNSDPSSYRGSNVGNAGEVQAGETPFNQWRLSSAGLPFGMVALKPEG